MGPSGGPERDGTWDGAADRKVGAVSPEPLTNFPQLFQRDALDLFIQWVAS